MDLTDFARQVLETDSLEVKLAAPPSGLTDGAPGVPLPTPSSPGRPVELRLRTGHARAAFPGADQLESNEEQRGILLHFFANHELLATELMALVLLKFPDAPPAFRRGILNTLAEEQRHTRWYLERMKECGVRFGDFSVSGYFWDAVAPMETPLDYVTRLSLTFEQANLDYARHYANVFASVGDTKTAKILDRVYRDEIGHVGYGLRWFRRWKEAGLSDWDAFEKRLPFPLSPSRAKATGSSLFNAEGRLAAGLDGEFVSRLEVFERSKGRTPNVYWFSPDEEAAMARGLDGGGYQARAEVASLAEDLEILPAFLAGRDDVVLMRTPPSEAHRRRLREAGFVLPEFEALAADGTLAAGSLIRDRKLHDLRPWGWGPQSARILGPLIPNLSGSARTLGDFWNEPRRSLYSKASDVALLETLVDGDAVPAAIVGAVCRSTGEIEDAIRRISACGFPAIFLKAPFGAAGQKNQRITADWSPDDPLRHWAEGILRQQGSLIVEPALDRVLDFSVQYEMTAEGLRKRGITHLENNARGQFVAARCGPKSARGLAPELARFYMETAIPAFESGENLALHLESRLRECGYTGPVGVDAFIYRAPGDGRLRLKPVVEVNPRFTMGRVALELQRRVAPGRCVSFEIVGKNPGASGARGDRKDGSIILNDAAAARQVLAVLRVATRMESLRQL